MNRTRLATVFTMALTSSFAFQASAETLSFAHGFSPAHYWTHQIIEPWMECVKETSNNEVEFDYFPGGQIVKYADSLDAMNNGLTQISTISVGYVSSQMPLNGVSMLPDMGATSSEMTTAYRKMLDDGSPLVDEFSKNRVHTLIINMLPAYQLITLDGSISSLDDLGGKVIRSSGGALTLTLNALGVAPAEMPSSELYVALQRGAVDGALSAISSIKPYNLQELVKGVSTNGVFGSFSTLLSMDLATYEGLSPELQTTFDDCGLQVERNVAQFLDKENEVLKTELADLGIEVYEFPPEMSEAMVEMLKPVADEYIERTSAQGVPSQEVYDAYRAALGK